MQGGIKNQATLASASNWTASIIQQQVDISQGGESKPASLYLLEKWARTAVPLVAKDRESSCSTYLEYCQEVPEGLAEKVVRLARKQEDIETCRLGCFKKFMKCVPRAPIQKWIWELEQLGLDLLADNLRADPTLAKYVPHEFIETLKHRNPTCLAPLERALLVVALCEFKERVGQADINTFRVRLWVWLGRMLRGGMV